MKNTAWVALAALMLSIGFGGTAAGESARVTIYYVLNTENQFHLVPVEATVREAEFTPEKALRLLLDGPPAGSSLRTLIPAGTRLVGCELANGILTVNLGEEIMSANVGSSGEALIIESLARTAGQFPGVEALRILVGGEPAESLAGHVDITGPIPIPRYRDTWWWFKGFPDTAGHWAEGEITALYAAGVLSGFPEGDFRPEDRVTRAQFVKMLIGARRLMAGAGGGGDGGGQAPSVGLFSDVASDAWYRPFLDRAVADGIVVPSDYGGVFGAGKAITRREAAMMLVRARGLESAAAEKRGAALPYTDTDSQPDWAKGYLAVALEQGLMMGDPGGSFRPHGPLTRAEACAVICRLAGLGGPNVFVLDPVQSSTVTGRVLVTGVARVFEATVCARVKQDGRVVAEGCTMATEGAPGWGFFGCMLELPSAAGNLSVEALTYSAKDGSEQDVVSRSVRFVP
ncbi:MAG: S-layer homology domain-containing protein [Firmicutes bacterium]|jgi:hypothetical protein|nr:S-layer homology domain-containing protein [Bacillota bacterium]